jgi:hypothetical protein
VTKLVVACSAKWPQLRRYCPDVAVDDSLSMAGLVRDWTDAWNACDEDALLALLHPEFRMHRMKGDVIEVLAAPKETCAAALAERGLAEGDLTFEWEAPAA